MKKLVGSVAYWAGLAMIIWLAVSWLEIIAHNDDALSGKAHDYSQWNIISVAEKYIPEGAE